MKVRLLLSLLIMLFVFAIAQISFAQNNSGFHEQSYLDVQDAIGGGMTAVAAADGLVYVVDGYALTILRYDENNRPNPLSRTIVPEHAPDLIVKNGRAYLLGDSLFILDVTNPAAPQRLGELAGFKFSDDLAIEGNYVYAAQSVDDIRVADVSNPRAPRMVHQASFDGGVTNLIAEGSIVYATGQSLLRIFDYAVPTAPQLVSETKILGGATDLAKRGNHLFFTQSGGTVRVVDVADLSVPVVLDSAEIGKIPTTIQIDGNFAYIASGSEGGLRILDIGDPAALRQVGNLSVVGITSQAVVDNGYVTLLRDGRQIQRVDVRAASTPRLVNSYSTIASASFVAVQGATAFVTGQSSGLAAIDISNPAQMRVLGSAFGVDGLSGLVVAADHAYAVSPWQGLGVYDVSDPSQPTFVQAVSLPIGVNVADIVQRDSFLYVAATDGLRIYDITLPHSPRLRSVTALSEAAAVAVSGNIVFVSVPLEGVYRFEVSDPAEPRQLQLLDIAATAGALTAGGGKAFISTENSGLCVFARELTCTAGVLRMSELVLADGLIYGTASNHSGVFVYELDEANRLKKRAHYANFSAGLASGLAVANEQVYMAQLDAGLLVYEDIARQPLPMPAPIPTSIAPTATPQPEIEFEYPVSYWQAYYYGNTEFTGEPILERGEKWIANQWNERSPLPNVVPADRFAVRWTRTVEMAEQQTMRFTVVADDAMRVYVNDKLLIDTWEEAPLTPLSAEIQLWAGQHRIRVEYVEYIGNATARVTMQRIFR